MFEFFDVKYKNILDIPSLLIEKEKVTALIGTSGSGKTTLLRLLNKMISPSEGKILYKGRDLKFIDSVLQRQDVTMLSQNPYFFAGNIRDNLNAVLNFQGKAELPDSALNKALEMSKLEKCIEESVCTLSGGEKQRLAFARILLLKPAVYLLDEPSSALDSETEDIFLQAIIEIAKTENKTVVMVTHSKAAAQKYSDVIIELSSGKVRI